MRSARQKMSHSNRNNNGFSLIDVLVMVAIVSVMATAIAALSNYNSKSQKNADIMTHSLDLMNELRLALGKRFLCTSNLKGLPLNASDSEGSAIPRIRFFNQETGQPSIEIIRPGASYRGRAFVSELRVIPLAQINTDEILASVSVTFEQEGQLGPSRIRRSLPIRSKVQAGVIEECTGGSDSDEYVNQKICEITSDGERTLNAAGECTTKIQRTWINGTADSAKCPSGMILVDEGQSCDFDKPEGWTDPRQVGRAYADGVVRQYGPPPASTKVSGSDPSTRFCTCSYASDVDNTGFTCMVACAPESSME